VTLRLKFSDEYLDAIRSGEKTRTARYDLERDVDSGDRLVLLTEDGEEIGTATVSVVGRMTAREYERGWTDRYRSLGQFLDTLRRHYPDVPGSEFQPSTEVTIVGWSRFNPREEYWREDPYARRSRGGEGR